jgi:hypothetical protein
MFSLKGEREQQRRWVLRQMLKKAEDSPLTRLWSPKHSATRLPQWLIGRQTIKIPRKELGVFDWPPLAGPFQDLPVMEPLGRQLMVNTMVMQFLIILI